MMHKVYSPTREVELPDGDAVMQKLSVYLGPASDVDLIKDQKNLSFVDVRGIIDRNNSHVNNIHGGLKMALEIEEGLRKGNDVFVFCDGGLERSPLAIALWLAWTENQTLEAAYHIIKIRKPDIFHRMEWVGKV